MKRFSFAGLVVSLIAVASAASASTTVGTIQSTDAYIWGERIGWINMNPAEGGLIITDTSITGYAWSRQYGWINFGPFTSGQKVANDGEGHLSGSAWVSGRGWLDMNGVTIDSSGVFHGLGGNASAPIGRVTFSCNHCLVGTDWRPASQRQQAGGGGGGNGFIPPAPSPISSTIPPEENEEVMPPSENQNQKPESTEPSPAPSDKPEAPKAPIAPSKPGNIKTETNKPLTLKPNEPGIIIRDAGRDGKAEVTVFGGTDKELTLDIKPVPVELYGFDPALRPIGDFFFNITAVAADGSVITEFPAPVKITLPIPESAASEQDFGVYRFEEESGEWVLVPETAVTPKAVIFYTNTIGRFAVLSAPGRPERIAPVSSGVNVWPLVGAGAALAGAWFVIHSFKR